MLSCNDNEVTSGCCETMTKGGNATVAPATDARSETSQPIQTDGNNGDLFQFITRLCDSFPVDTGALMTINDLLVRLKSSQPDVFTALDNLKETAQVVSKPNESVSIHWKEKGNNEYTRGMLQDSILSYTHSLICAETDTTIATTLNNRSTAFFEIGQYVNACLDAHRTLHYKTDYWKALQRRGRALEELGFRDAGQKDVLAALDKSFESSNSRDTIDNILGDVMKCQADLALPPRATLRAPLKVERTIQGRGLFSRQRLNCGTVLEETPYALVARAEVLLSVCSYCLQHTSCLYPGDVFRRAAIKSRGLFCSEICAEAAWRYYGQFESTNPFFLMCPNDVLLATRVALYGVQQFPELELNNAAPDFDEVGHNQFGASHMQMLTTFSKELQNNAVVGGCESIVAAIGLYMKAFTASEAELVRKAQRQIHSNALDVSLVLRLGQGKDPNMERKSMLYTNSAAQLGKAMYAIGSLFNHACDPNCFASFVGGPRGSSPKLVVRAIRPIMEGEELTLAYAGIDAFHFHSMRNRLQTLRNRYGFICRCTTCVNQVDESVGTEGKEHYIKAADYYQKGCQLTRNGKYDTAVTVLLQSYEIVMRYICPPPNPPQMMVPKTHRALALAYYHMNNLDKCAEHLKAALETDLLIHKTEYRVEMINEYTRLAAVLRDPEERRVYGEKALELVRCLYAPSPLLEVEIANIQSVYKIVSVSGNESQK
ncbi:unnamed protein product [Phytomonas sp. Hart1]|nr:unnamed protein product [Phytomonas sp. Hart1]|eukprot:CCW66619.1 unnamed protein product [Phytomonas sp. isolate Hart1]